MLQMHQSALRGPAEHFPLPLLPRCPGDQPWHTSFQPNSRERKKYSCLYSGSLMKSQLESVISPSLLFSLSALFLDTLSWTMSAEWRVVKAVSQERPSGKHTAGPEWEVYFAWCMNICGVWGSVHRGLQEPSSFCTEGFITAAPSRPPPPPLSLSKEIIFVHPHCILITPNSSLILIFFPSLFFCRLK